MSDCVLPKRDQLELLPSWGTDPTGDDSLETGSWLKLIRKFSCLSFVLTHRLFSVFGPAFRSKGLLT